MTEKYGLNLSFSAGVWVGRICRMRLVGRLVITEPQADVEVRTIMLR